MDILLRRYLLNIKFGQLSLTNVTLKIFNEQNDGRNSEQANWPMGVNKNQMR